MEPLNLENRKDSSASERVLLATVRDLEARLQAQQQTIQRLSSSVEQLLGSAQNSRLAEQQIHNRLSQQESGLRAISTQVQEILGSRIWKTLVGWSAVAMRLPFIGSKLGARPPQVSASTGQRSGFTSAQLSPAAPKELRASASRHSNGKINLAGWTEHLNRAIDARPRSTVPQPRISIVTPTYNTRVNWFAEAAISVLEQSFGEWEWCIVDDCSNDCNFHDLFRVLEKVPQIKIRRLHEPHGISRATNEALKMAEGEFVCFLDHDDLLARSALEECWAALANNLDAVYTDSDKVDEYGLRSEPFHKPDWSPEYFRSVMYIGHLLCVRLETALAVGAFKLEFDGVQDFEFMLRFSESTNRIGHIDKILYHWRAVPGSVAANSWAKPNIEPLQQKAVQSQLDRLGLPATAQRGPFPQRVRVIPNPRTHHPKVSIIIPTKDAPDVLENCLTSIFEKSSYPVLEVLCIDNNSQHPRAISLMKNAFPVKRIPYHDCFNFSRVSNLGVQHADGTMLVFLNNDIEVITPDWIEQMLYYAEQADVGAVGGLLTYPDSLVQHAGVVLGCRGTADHVLRRVPSDVDGYAGSLSCAREVSAVTAACLMVRRHLFEEAGGFNEHFFTAYQDVDLCLQLRNMGKRNIYTPNAVLIHHESYSRGKYYDFIDRNLLLDRWEEVIQRGDPYYNSHFNLEACDYTLQAG